MTDNTQPLTESQREALREITGDFHADVAWARGEFANNLQAAYMDYAKRLQEERIDALQYPAPSIDQERA